MSLKHAQCVLIFRAYFIKFKKYSIHDLEVSFNYVYTLELSCKIYQLIIVTYKKINVLQSNYEITNKLVVGG